MKVLKVSEPIQMISWLELPKDIQRDFLYCEGEYQYDSYFFEYEGEWYYENDFSCIDIEPWTGMLAIDLSFRLLIRYVDDGEFDKIIVGYANWWEN